MSALAALYEAERQRLRLLAQADTPQGEYLRPVFGSGSAAAGLVMIGEAPGAEETAKGTPFVGKAGAELDSLLKLADISRENIYITNTVKYRPVKRSEKTTRNRTPSAAEIRASMPLLEAELAELSPRMIVTLGNVPLGALLMLLGEEKAVIGLLHGTGKVCRLHGRETMLFPLYHPASAIYQKTLLPVLEQDAIQMGNAFRAL